MKTSMKLKITLLFLFAVTLCKAQSDEDFSKFEISERHVDSITTIYNTMLKSEGEEKKAMERLFFEALPNSYTEMSDAMYIHLRKEYEAYKAKNEIPPINVPHPWVAYLSTMDYPDKTAYYQKYFNICIGGEYGADEQVLGFEIYKRFLMDTDRACLELKKRNDADISAVFYFIFDETHPAYNEESIALYHEMLSNLKQRDTRLAGLLQSTYARILEEQKQY